MQTRPVRRFLPVLLLSAVVPLLGVSVDEVDPFIGVDRGGNLLPGPVRPFGLVRLGPDCATVENNNGYGTGKPILGFSHNHLSGTGGGARYGNLLAIPQIGELLLPAGAFAAVDEVARPGYYAVTLGDSGVRAELTSTARSGWHRYRFPSGSIPRVLLDVARSTSGKIKDGVSTGAQCDQADVTVVDDRTLEGRSAYSGGWGGRNPYVVHWVARFAEPFARSGFWTNLADPRPRSRNGKYHGVWVEFASADRPVVFKVGLSYRSIENARLHVEEKAGFDFDGVTADSSAEWNRHLALVDVKGGTKERRTVFATALYRTFLKPADLTGDNPGWDSKEPHYWDYYAIWDTFRTLMPLHTLIQPKRQAEILRCLLDVYAHRGWIPDVWTAGDWGMVQGGTDVDVAFADAAVKGLAGVDFRKALEGCRKNGEVEGEAAFWQNTKVGRRLTNYLSKGWVESEVPLSVSHTLEYAYCDFGIAQIAHAIGDAAVASLYLERSRNAFQLFQTNGRFFWGRNRAGEFETNREFAKVDAKSPSGVRMFYEGSAWNYATSVPQDHAGLIGRHGGPSGFVDFLDRMFDEKRFEMGNEPGFLQPYQYVWAGRPDRTAERVRMFTTNSFRAARGGWPGNDDAGAMSSWYLFGVLGFYPVAGQDLYILSSPQFEESTLDLGDGRKFTVRAKGTSGRNLYVTAATLNGKLLDRAWLTHGEIAAGGILDLAMGETSSSWGRTKVPPSMHLGPIRP